MNTTPIVAPNIAPCTKSQVILFAIKAGNVANRLATTADSLGSVFNNGGRRLEGGVSRGLGVLIVPLQGLGQSGWGIIDEAPCLEEIKDPADGTDVAYEGPPNISKGDLPWRIISELLNNGVPVVHVNFWGFRMRPRFEELRQQPDLTFVYGVPREPSRVAGDMDRVGFGEGRRRRRQRQRAGSSRRRGGSFGFDRGW